MGGLERGAQCKWLQHVAFDIDIAMEIGLRDVRFVQGPDGLDRARIMQIHMEAGPPAPTIRSAPSGMAIENGVAIPPTLLMKASSALAAGGMFLGSLSLWCLEFHCPLGC